MELNRSGPGIAPCSTQALLVCCVIYIIYHIAHMYGTMVFLKAPLSLGQCLMATQHTLCMQDQIIRGDL